MKRILILLAAMISVAQAQFSPTSSKTAFKNGISIGTRDSTAYSSADSLILVINRAGRLIYRSTDGYWKLLANAASSDYVPYTGSVDNVALGNFRLTARSIKTDSIYANSSAGMYLTTNTGATVAHLGGGGSVEVDFKGFAGYDANRSASYTARSFTDKGYVDSADALRVKYTDTAAMLSNYRRKTTLIENSDLRNSAITINGSSTALGGSVSVGTVTSVAASAGTGISVSGSPITGSGTLTITNTAPDQTVTLTAGSGISVSGTYPNFTITNSSPSSGGTVTSVSAGVGMSFTTITSSGAVNADTTVLATRAYAAGLDVAKANTSLNNVNGVLSSTYGGAGSVSGILKANGSGVVSAAVNNTDYTLLNGTGFVRMSGTTPSYVTGTSSQFLKADGSLDGTSYATAASLGSYLPLSGGTLTGALSGTSLSMSGGGVFGGSSAQYLSRLTTYYNPRSNNGPIVVDSRSFAANVGAFQWFGGQYNSSSAYRPFGGIGAQKENATDGNSLGYLAFWVNQNAADATEAMRISSNRNLLIKTTTDNGTDALQVNGSATFSSSVTSNSTIAGGNLLTGVTSYGKWEIGSDNNYDGFYIYKSGGAYAMGINKTTYAATFSSSVTAGSFVKSGGTSSQTLMADGSVQTVTSGTYTPTFTNTANVTASSLQQATYIRQGNITTVFVCGELTPTAANTQTLLHLTLPQSTSYSLSQSYIGTGTIYDISNEANSSGNVSISSSDTTKAFIRCYPTSINPVKFSFTFQYIN